jgi:hypothetical protein
MQTKVRWFDEMEGPSTRSDRKWGAPRGRVFFVAFCRQFAMALAHFSNLIYVFIDE